MKRKYHRYLLKTFVLAAGFIADAGVSAAALPDATAALRRAPLPAVLADTATFEWVDSTRINIRLLLGSGDVRITTDDRLILMPRIVSASGDSVYELPPVEFAGRRNKKYFDRRAALRRAERPSVYAPGDTARFVYAIWAEPWMRRSELRLELYRDFEDCCCVTSLPASVLGRTEYIVPHFEPVVPWVSVAEQIAVREPVLVPMSEYKPFNPNVPLRKRKDALYVHFAVSKWDLREDFRNNRETLGRILDMVRRIEADTLSSVAKIRIIGLASAEGPVALNERLSRNRAQVLKDYLVNHGVSLPDSTYELVAGGEAWADLRDVIAESNLEGREELLRIVDETADPNRREALIRRHNRGRSFDYLRQHVFADQRNSGYIQVYYEAVPDIAARKINEAIRLINAGKSDEAVTLLEPVADARKWNTLGSAYYLSGRKQEALDCFRKAVEAGNEGARQNLEALERVLGISH